MKAFFIGCSFTRGDELPDPNIQAWPALVAKAKQFDFVNQGASGGTNDRIMYQTVKHVDDFDRFYIAWTSPDRFTRYRSDNHQEVHFQWALKHDLYHDTYEYQTYGKLHYSFWHSRIFGLKLWLQRILLLQSFLHCHQKKYVMISTFNNPANLLLDDWSRWSDHLIEFEWLNSLNQDQLRAEHDEIQNLSSKIDRSHFIGWPDQSLNKITDASPRGPMGHPLIQGHELIARYILEHDTN